MRYAAAPSVAPAAFLRTCLLACLISATPAFGATAAVSVQGDAVQVDAAPHRVLEVRTGDRVVFRSPPEGLWSVATDWKDGWPAGWHHAQPAKVEHVAEWTIVSAVLTLPSGNLEVRDAYRPEGNVVRCLRRFTWRGKEALPRCTLSVRWMASGAKNAQALLPGILYYGNPSGARTGANAVAVYTGKAGEKAIFEEHRYPIPFASVEWREGQNRRGAALHTLPSPASDANHRDQWWSLGTIAHDDDTELTLLSGPCAANGKNGVVKAIQNKFLEYPDAWLNLRPGAIVEKTFWLEAYPVAQQGSGFRVPLRTAMNRYAPFQVAGLPKFDQIIRDKYRFACSRYRDIEKTPGFEMFPDFVEGTHYVMGWCGQAEAVGGAMLAMSPRLGDPKATHRAVQSLDHLATAPFNERGFLLKYTVETHRWADQDEVSQGQAMENFARAILIAKRRGDVDATRWQKFLRKACEIHASRILRDDWRPVSTNEAFFVSPLCKAYALFGDETFRRAAIKAAEHYAKRHLDMTEPYWGGTLDARCEDKEGALAAFQAFLAVYEMTQEPRYLDWTAHAMDVALTYTVLWDIDLPAGRLRDHGFKTRGWTVVSAQNQHLDVFGVLLTPELWRAGTYLHRDDLKALAALMYRSCGQIIDPQGSQGEQIQHTNFAQSGEMSDVFRMRGGYSEDWTVFWITAHFLNAAGQFEQMGVDLDRLDREHAKPRAQ
jgi:hypothetical protein